MRAERQEKRQRQIEAAAYEVLAEKGYKATSMLVIARHAAASNETLYRWYGNKQALFASLVRRNAQAARTHLERSVSDNADPIEVLKGLAPMLLETVTSDRAVALNRAAVGDVHETATLGATIAEGGRDAILPLLAGLIEAGRKAGVLDCDDSEEAAETFIGLLIGDLQIRRAIGVLPPLEGQEIAARAERALRLFLRLYGSRR